MLTNIIKFLIAALLAVSCGGSENNNQNDKPIQSSDLKLVFDIKALAGKNIDELATILENLVGSEPTELQLKEGIIEWEKIYKKDNYELLITYNAKTRAVIDFFIPTNDPSGKTADYSDLLKICALGRDEAGFVIEPIKVIGNGNEYTGIKIRIK